MAKSLGCTVAQLALAWALAKGVAVVTKTENESRMKENLLATQVTLTASQIQTIDKLNKNQRLFWNPYAIQWEIKQVYLIVYLISVLEWIYAPTKMSSKFWFEAFARCFYHWGSWKCFTPISSFWYLSKTSQIRHWANFQDSLALLERNKPLQQFNLKMCPKLLNLADDQF